jgi:Mg-chelatase subunit ChlD
LLLAEKGEKGLEEFVERHLKNDPRLAKRLRRMQERLLAEAEDLKRRLRSEYDLKREAERERAETIVARLRAEEERLAVERAQLSAKLPEDILRQVRDIPIIQMVVAPPKLSFWRRLYNQLWRFLRWIWRGLLALLGRRHRHVWKPKAIAIGVPGLGGPGLELEMDLETALRANPDLRRRIRAGMGPTFAARTRRMWRILLGIENYAEVAQEILEQQAAQAAKKQFEENQAVGRRLDGELENDRRDREDRERLMREELARLDEAEKREEQRLRETLAQRPAGELRRLVVEELESAGLIEKWADGIRLTGRFLDTFAALVYTEEAKGVAAVKESALGTSIEGEGILEKTRMLSYAETGHMDAVGTLVNARTRHPHVRHLVDEDVVVYRELRATEVHIVIVVDQSLSMEENDRIVAAKRAALALYYQTRRKGSKHRIDFVLMETTVRRASLAEVWDAKPKGFTNVGRALQVAHELLDRSRANRKILFLVTDGLPEAVTFEGKDVAAKPEEALQYALRAAAKLRRIPGLAFSIVLLEAKDPLFVAAAEKIAKKVGGRVTRVEPNDLAKSLLVQVRQDELLAR